MANPNPDLEHIDFFLWLGSNPVVSQMSVLSVINPLAKRRAIEARGGKGQAILLGHRVSIHKRSRLEPQFSR